MVLDSSFLISPGARLAPAMSQEDIYLHICPGCTSCGIPARALEIFAGDCAEVPKHSALPYLEASHTRQSTKTRFRNS